MDENTSKGFELIVNYIEAQEVLNDQATVSIANLETAVVQLVAVVDKQQATINQLIGAAIAESAVSDLLAERLDMVEKRLDAGPQQLAVIETSEWFVVEEALL